MDTRTHIEKINDIQKKKVAPLISRSNIVSQIRNALINELASGKKLDRDESINAGKELRKKVPRSSHAAWDVKPDRSEIVDMISEQEKTRIPELIPVRHQRMTTSPFTFYRASAVIMARDLSQTSTTDIRVQACGDAHIGNFGMFASPERRLVFDINDFDETLPAPWEWDIKRLVASVEICGRDRGFSDEERSRAVRTAAEGYREGMQKYSEMGALDVYYDHMDVEKIYQQNIDRLTSENRRLIQKTMEKALAKNREKAFGKFTELTVDGHVQIKSDPPLIVPFRDMADSDFTGIDREGVSELISLILKKYRLSLPKERRYLIDQYSIRDAARKVAGVGSVGTRAWIIVLEGAGIHDPLILQVKEAEKSVLEKYAGDSVFIEHGRRVVEGQRAIRTAGDILTGWVRFPDKNGHILDYYVRQLWDFKGTIDLSKITAEDLTGYAGLCGVTLAHAHAKTGNRFSIASYIGKGDVFIDAMEAFAKAYADQNEADYNVFLNSLK